MTKYFDTFSEALKFATKEAGWWVYPTTNDGGGKQKLPQSILLSDSKLSGYFNPASYAPSFYNDYNPDVGVNLPTDKLFVVRNPNQVCLADDPVLKTRFRPETLWLVYPDGTIDRCFNEDWADWASSVNWYLKRETVFSFIDKFQKSYDILEAD